MSCIRSERHTLSNAHQPTPQYQELHKGTYRQLAKTLQVHQITWSLRSGARRLATFEESRDEKLTGANTAIVLCVRVTRGEVCLDCVKAIGCANYKENQVIV